MRKWTIKLIVCLLLLGTWAVASAKQTPILKKYDELWKLVQTEIETAKHWKQHLTVIAISRYNYKTVDAVIARLQESGYTVQTNSKRHRMAMVVSWSDQ